MERPDRDAVLAVFGSELRERIRSVAEALAALQSHREEAEARPVAVLWHEAHTLRGTASMLHLTRLEELTRAVGAAAEGFGDGSDEVDTIVDATSAMLTELRRVAETVPAETASTPPRPAGRPDGPIVLHVEDNLSNLKLVERVLARRPHAQLVEAKTGQEGLELARTLRPALVLLDLRLPDISGEEVLEALRADPVTRELRVVVVSAEARPIEASRVLALGADDFLVKPIEIDALLQVVDDAVGVEA